MAKDKGGHGSEKRGGGGGARYEVQVQPYSLAINKVGQHIGSPTVISRHNSLDAAGRVLARMNLDTGEVTEGPRHSQSWYGHGPKGR
jgi:hypothetical protein